MVFLNVDCWHMILEYLKIEDKIALANTNEYMRYIVKENLRYNRSVTVDQKLWHQLCRYETKVRNLMECFNENVEEMELNGMNSVQFEVARYIQFPKMSKLKIKHINTRAIYHRPDDALLDVIHNTCDTLDELTLIDCFWHDLNMLRNCDFPNVKSVRVLCKFDFVEDYEQVAKIFPAIKKLSIMAPITSKTLWNLKCLEELEITLDEYTFSIISFITDSNLDRLTLRKLSILKNQASCEDRHHYFDFINFLVLFEQLDELQIDCHATSSLSFFLLQRKQVRKIIFSYENLFFCDCGHDWLWIDIIGRNKFRGQIEGITINSYLLRKCPDLKKFLTALLPRLKRLRIFDKYATGEDEFRYDHLDVKAQLLEEVPKFIIESLGWHNSIEETRAALLEMIANCELLESLDICANVCNLEFLSNLVEVVRFKYGLCRKHFTVRCHNTNITAENLKELSLPVGMQIILKSKDFEKTDLDTVEIEFTKHSVQQTINDFMGMILLPY